MRQRLIWATTLALLFAPSLLAEEPEGVPGTVTLSDGTVLSGPIRTTRGKPLRLFDPDGRRRDLEVEDIHLIRIHVVNEEEYRIWRWVEDGSREKVYTGESYPKREYETEVVLKSGQILLGHLVAVLYVYEEGREKPKKVILRKKDQGEVGETLEDIVHVESVRMEGPAPMSMGAQAGIRLTVSPPTALLAAHALPRERDRSCEAVMGRKPGIAYFPDLLPGTYDLAIVTPKAIHVHLAVGEGGGKPVADDVLDEVRSRVAEIPDFFEERTVLAAVRSGDTIRAVVRKKRTGPTSMDGKLVFRRVEIWSMHKGGDRWLVDNRSYIWREHGEELPPPREMILTPALGGVDVATKTVEREFTLPGEEGR